MMCMAPMVCRLRSISRDANNSNPAIPVTSHGTTSGAPTRPVVSDRPGNRNRVMAHAVQVPRTTHTGATMAASTSEFSERAERRGIGERRSVPLHREPRERQSDHR